jgi:hypothetical protein
LCVPRINLGHCNYEKAEYGSKSQGCSGKLESDKWCTCKLRVYLNQERIYGALRLAPKPLNHHLIEHSCNLLVKYKLHICPEVIAVLCLEAGNLRCCFPGVIEKNGGQGINLPW